jgi:hypothetical protein
MLLLFESFNLGYQEVQIVLRQLEVTTKFDVGGYQLEQRLRCLLAFVCHGGS